MSVADWGLTIIRKGSHAAIDTVLGPSSDISQEQRITLEALVKKYKTLLDSEHRNDEFLLDVDSMRLYNVTRDESYLVVTDYDYQDKFDGTRDARIVAQVSTDPLNGTPVRAAKTSGFEDFKDRFNLGLKRIGSVFGGTDVKLALNPDERINISYFSPKGDFISTAYNMPSVDYLKARDKAYATYETFVRDAQKPSLDKFNAYAKEFDSAEKTKLSPISADTKKRAVDFLKVAGIPYDNTAPIERTCYAIGKLLENNDLDSLTMGRIMRHSGLRAGAPLDNFSKNLGLTLKPTLEAQSAMLADNKQNIDQQLTDLKKTIEVNKDTSMAQNIVQFAREHPYGAIGLGSGIAIGGGLLGGVVGRVGGLFIPGASKLAGATGALAGLGVGGALGWPLVKAGYSKDTKDLEAFLGIDYDKLIAAKEAAKTPNAKSTELSKEPEGPAVNAPDKDKQVSLSNTPQGILAEISVKPTKVDATMFQKMQALSRGSYTDALVAPKTPAGGRVV